MLNLKIMFKLLGVIVQNFISRGMLLEMQLIYQNSVDMMNLYMNWNIFSTGKTYWKLWKKDGILFTQKWCLTLINSEKGAFWGLLGGQPKGNETSSSYQMRRCNTWAEFNALKALF